MKKSIMAIALCIVCALCSCNSSSNSKQEEKKLVSELDSICLENGLGDPCMVKCTFGKDFDNWIDQEDADMFLHSSVIEAKSMCKNEGTFVPKNVNVYSVDTFKTDNGKEMYHCRIYIDFVAANAFGVKDLLKKGFDKFFFKGYDSKPDNLFYPCDHTQTFMVTDESTFKEYVKYKIYKKESKLDSFTHKGYRYVIYDQTQITD